MRWKIGLAFVVSVSLLQPVAGWAQGGYAFFNPEINWAGVMYYTVAGGPPHTCGDLWAKRNAGPWQKEAGGWLCTDGSGNAVKGPWSLNNQAGDEKALVYIQWPSGSATTIETHIWDKTAPSVTLASTTGTPPPSFSGTATDPQWGAGFNSNWTECYATFRENNTFSYWSPSRSRYDLGAAEFNCTITGMPGHSISWSVSPVPPASAHVPGYCYRWEVLISDGGNWKAARKDFCY